MYYIVRFSRGWSDEFEVTGFKIMTDKEWSLLSDLLEQYADVQYDFPFGSNQSGWGETVGDYAACLTATTLSQAAAEELINLGMRTFGMFWDYSDLVETLEADSEEAQ